MYSDNRLYLPDLIPLEPREERISPPKDEDEVLQEIRDRKLEAEHADP